MPKALKDGPYRFFFWSRENNEPPHVHVRRERFEAKFWIPPIDATRSSAMSPRLTGSVLTSTATSVTCSSRPTSRAYASPAAT